MRILLAEDNELNQDLAVRLLEKRGHEVTVVENGARAVEVHADDPAAFDIILMDLNMPRMDGRSATRVIRTAEEGTGRRIPILAMTATASRAEIRRALRAGMDGCIEKPIDVQRMLAAIERGARGERDGDAPEAAPRPVDWEDALRLVGGDAELLGGLAQRFLRVEGELLAAVGDAIERADGAALEEAAHKLRGALGNFAADAACDWAQRLEHLGATRDLAAAPAAFEQLAKHMETVRADLRTRAAESGGP